MDKCKTAALNRSLDEALDQSFPASDPSALSQPAGDIRDAAGCCCSPREEPYAPETKASCCGITNA